MNENSKLTYLAGMYRKFRAEHPSLRARLPKEVFELASELSEAGVTAARIAEVCKVSVSTANSWVRRKKEGSVKQKRSLTPSLGSASMMPPLTDSNRVSLRIGGVTVQGSLNDMRRILGF